MPCLRKSVVTLLAALASGLAPPLAHADISGFDNLMGWQYNFGDAGTPADLPNPNTIHLTTLGGSERRSVFYLSTQATMHFVATFSYRILNAGGACDLGAAFVIQNSPIGPAALGGDNGGFGYSGITNSAAVTLQPYGNRSGVFTGGVIGGGSSFVNPVNLLSGHWIDVTLAYDGTFISRHLRDTVTLDESFTPNILLGNLAAITGSPTAYVGFTASSGNCSSSDQYFSGFQFTTTPEPGTLTLITTAAVVLLRRFRQSRYLHCI